MTTLKQTCSSETQLPALILNLPLELHLDIIDLDYNVKTKWSLLSKHTATTTKFDVDMKRHGKWIKQSKTGQITEQCTYTHGKLDGERNCWYSNGQQREQYHYADGKQEGEYNMWVDGQLRETCCYVSGKRHGEFNLWHSSGKPKEVCNYVNGAKQGERKRYYSNGSISQQCYFLNNELEGEVTEWFKGYKDVVGSVYEKSHYYKGKLHGTFRQWYRKGNMKREKNFVNGIQKGENKFWRRDGTLVQ
mmetsp:Transcript_18572/g.20649  ORF Transcript_18572/g.20649 Transcript_18572/m.20649 type:complete len:247 (-) Transcript_18572:180-920(-)